MSRFVSRREIILLVLVLLLGVLALAYVLFFRPKFNQLQVLSTQKQALAQQIVMQQSNAPTASAGQATPSASPQASAAAKAVEAHLPQAADEAGFLQTIAQTATQSHVVVTSVQAVLPSAQTGAQTTNSQAGSTSAVMLPSVQFELRVQGTSAHMESFLQGLHDARRLLSVSTVDMQGYKGPLVQGDFNVLAYYAPAAQ